MMHHRAATAALLSPVYDNNNKQKKLQKQKCQVETLIKTKAVTVELMGSKQAEIQTENLHSHQTGRQRQTQTNTHTHTNVSGAELLLLLIIIGNSFLPSIGSKSETPLSLRHTG